MSKWLEVGKIDDIPVLGARVVETATGKVAVFRTRDNCVYALEDKCPHKGGPISQGIVHDHKVTCPMHNWTITLKDGLAVAPDEGRIKSFAVKTENETVFLNL